MATKQQILKNLQFEIEKLKENPIYQDYLKLSKVLHDGELIQSALIRKINYFKSLAQPEPEEQEEEYEEVPQPKRRMASPEQVRETRNRPPITQERERELDKKVKESSFEVDPDEFGLNDDSIGLPDDLEDDENEDGGN